MQVASFGHEKSTKGTLRDSITFAFEYFRVSAVAGKTVLVIDFQNFIAEFNDAISLRVFGSAGFSVFLESAKHPVAEF